MFDNLTREFGRIFKTLSGRGKLSEKNIEDAIREIKISLLAADVNLNVVKEFIADVKEKALGSKVLDSLTPDRQFIKIVSDELEYVLGEETDFSLKFKPPVIIMMVGLQGSGKTTTAGKLALRLKKDGKRVYLVPADLKRPAAVEQLKVLGRSQGIEVFDPTGGDPVKAAEEACAYAAKYGFDAVIIDTAGRLHVDAEMMDEVKKISGKVEPHHIIFVADAPTGQDAVKSAGAFSEALKLTGVILTKLDGDARGGAALSVKKVVGAPILFTGVGEKPEDLERFVPARMASRILGMGDMMLLIEKAAATVGQEDAEKWTSKIVKGRFDLEDMLSQLKGLKKIGSMTKILGMLPMGNKLAGKIDGDELGGELKKKEAIICSMTPKERRTPGVLNGSRRKRIATGSGVEVSDVNRLIKEFEMMQKMMKRNFFPSHQGRGRLRKGILS